MQDLSWRFYCADYYADCTTLIVQIHRDCALYSTFCHALHRVRDLSWRFHRADDYTDCATSIMCSLVQILLYKSIVPLCEFHYTNSIMQIASSKFRCANSIIHILLCKFIVQILLFEFYHANSIVQIPFSIHRH